MYNSIIIYELCLFRLNHAMIDYFFLWIPTGGNIIIILLKTTDLLVNNIFKNCDLTIVSLFII